MEIYTDMRIRALMSSIRAHACGGCGSHRSGDCLPTESRNRCNKLIGVGYIAATRFIAMRHIAAMRFAITRSCASRSPYARYIGSISSLSSRDERLAAEPSSISQRRIRRCIDRYISGRSMQLETSLIRIKLDRSEIFEQLTLLVTR
jgi:hypothetical protein